jgi:predicted enzyme related to lactoylglutathione lyase
MPRREIAQRRGTSVEAVKYHARNIAGKLGVASAHELRHWPGQPFDRAPRSRKELDMTTALKLGPLGQVSLLMRDTARAEAFYGDVLGLPHVFTFGDLAFFDAGGVRVYLRKVDEKEWRPSSILYFLVDDISAAHEELARRGVKFLGAPHLIYRDDATGSEEWMAFFEDPEGNTLGVMARVPAPTDATTAATAGSG